MTHAQPQKKSVFNMNVDLMHGPILKSLLLFMLPILVSNLFQQLYNTVDTMIVGNVLGDTALAAIGSRGSGLPVFTTTPPLAPAARSTSF